MSPPEVLMPLEQLDAHERVEWPDGTRPHRAARRNTPEHHAENAAALATLYRAMPAEVLRVARTVLRDESVEVLRLHLEDTPTPQIVEAAGVRNRGTVYVTLHGRDGKPGAIESVLLAMRNNPATIRKVEKLVAKKSKPSPAAVLCAHLALCSERRQWDSYIEMSTLHQLSLLVDVKQRANMLDLPMPRRVVQEVLPHLRDQGWVEFDGNFVVIVRSPPIPDEAEEATDG